MLELVAKVIVSGKDRDALIKALEQVVSEIRGGKEQGQGENYTFTAEVEGNELLH